MRIIVDTGSYRTISGKTVIISRVIKSAKTQYPVEGFVVVDNKMEHEIWNISGKIYNDETPHEWDLVECQ